MWPLTSDHALKPDFAPFGRSDQAGRRSRQFLTGMRLICRTFRESRLAAGRDHMGCTVRSASGVSQRFHYRRFLRIWLHLRAIFRPLSGGLHPRSGSHSGRPIRIHRKTLGFSRRFTRKRSRRFALARTPYPCDVSRIGLWAQTGRILHRVDRPIRTRADPEWSRQAARSAGTAYGR
jgi:hypothetical protein